MGEAELKESRVRMMADDIQGDLFGAHEAQAKQKLLRRLNMNFTESH